MGEEEKEKEESETDGEEEEHEVQQVQEEEDEREVEAVRGGGRGWTGEAGERLVGRICLWTQCCCSCSLRILTLLQLWCLFHPSPAEGEGV